MLRHKNFSRLHAMLWWFLLYFYITSSYVKININHVKKTGSQQCDRIWEHVKKSIPQISQQSILWWLLKYDQHASYQCILRFFHSTCLKYCACHKKNMPGHTKCCTCQAKSSHQTYRSDAPKCNPSGNQRPNLLTSLICTVPATRHASLQRPPSFLEMQQNPHVLLTFGRVENPSRLPHKTTLQRPKVSAKPMPQAAISSAPRRGRKLLPKWGPKTSGHFWSIGGHKSKMLLWTTLSPSSTCGVLVDAVRSEAGGILGGLSWELWKTQPITSWPHGFWMLFGRWLRFRKILIIDLNSHIAYSLGISHLWFGCLSGT